MNSEYIAAGLMSGTSLDGLDMAICRFREENNRWQFELLEAKTVPYEGELRKRLAGAHLVDGHELSRLNYDFGVFSGEQVLDLLNHNSFDPVLIASHGHTVFHEPDEGISIQIGSGAAIASVTGITTVSDFRSADVALGGQGAPLVPVGDINLFGGHKFYMNLGGIANLTIVNTDNISAFDICPVNMALNYLAGFEGMSFDENGSIAISGSINPALLDKLDALGYYKLSPPKSLGREWFEKEMKPLISDESISIADRMHTTVHHIAKQISEQFTHQPGTTLFVTGGGAMNGFLIETISEYMSRHGIHLIIPGHDIICFKEAIVFAFLGLLRVLERENVLAEVTGASRNSVSGAVYYG